MKKRLFRLTPLLALLLSGCYALPWNAPRALVVELKYNTDKPLPSNMKVELVTNSSISSTNMKVIGPKKVTAAYTIFYEDRRYIAAKIGDNPVQVFELKIPSCSRARDWTGWLEPDFIDKSAFPSFDLLHNQRKENRVSEIPAEHLQLRYKIE